MEFKRLSDVSLIEEASDIANVLIEENGEIKRVPKTQVGGTGFPTAIIKDSFYDNTLAGLQTMMQSDEPTFECLNMTFEEAYGIMARGEILEVIGMLSNGACLNVHGIPIFTGTESGVPCIILCFTINDTSTNLYWTVDGISWDPPASSK